MYVCLHVCMHMYMHAWTYSFLGQVLEKCNMKTDYFSVIHENNGKNIGN